MRRRDFVRASAAGAAAAAASIPAYARKRAPEYMPIVREKMESGSYLPYYEEREITEPVMLCDGEGNLNPEAIGWSRVPLTTANMKGHWPRKKRWNFWNWICPDFVFSVTVADIDYGSFCGVTFTDFNAKKQKAGIALKPGNAVYMPEEVERTIEWKGGGVDYSMINEGGDIQVRCKANNVGGKKIIADFIIHKPQGHETLNIVVPWSESRFQMNSKHNTLPAEGYVKVGDKKYVMDPEDCHGVQDFGRGMWPYRSYWNWAVCTGKQNGDLVGVNLGARWTTGTGSNENGICYNGKLYKIMEDLTWDYDPNAWENPWHIYSTHTDAVDMTLHPFLVNDTRVDIGLVGTGGACPFGTWTGTIKFGGKTVEIDHLIGWAEEFKHRW